MAAEGPNAWTADSCSILAVWNVTAPGKQAMKWGDSVREAGQSRPQNILPNAEFRDSD